MTDPKREHAQYDELAAGHALHALEPEDELEFVAHAGQCPRCQQALAGYADVAAALADTAPAAEPSPQLAERILAAARADSTRSSGPDSRPDEPGAGHASARTPPGVASLQERRRRRLTRLAAAAAAVVVIAGGGAGLWHGLSAGGGSPRPPAAGCARASQCHEVQLTDAAGHRHVARVIVTAGSVWLMPSGLPADDRSRQVYVLWQITGKHTPLAIGSFDVGRHSAAPIRIGKLAVPYRSTWAFAVSIEHGRTIPASPSRPVALGQVSA